jgi:hypothetical protein
MIFIEGGRKAFDFITMHAVDIIGSDSRAKIYL